MSFKTLLLDDEKVNDKAIDFALEYFDAKDKNELKEKMKLKSIEEILEFSKKSPCFLREYYIKYII